MLRSIAWWFVIDVSGKDIGPIFFLHYLTLEEETDNLVRNVDNRPFLMNLDETAWLASLIPPLFCYYADNSQLSEALSVILFH
jgi:hypothetical protein